MNRVDAVDKAIAAYIWEHHTIDTAELAKIAIEASDACLAEHKMEAQVMSEWTCPCGDSGLRPSHNKAAICSVCGANMYPTNPNR